MSCNINASPLPNCKGTQAQSSPQPPPRPQRPFTEYNVFFRLERELLLQGKPDGIDDLEKIKAEKKILSSGRKIESSDVAARRPRQYRHLIMPVDWMVVGNSTSSVPSFEATPFGKRSTNQRKKKETHAKSKFTFLELTKLISSRWREVCQNDPETKEFCKKIADGEAARYKAELEDYRIKYGVEAAKCKKRKSRKSQMPESDEKTKQVKEEEENEFDMLNNFVPVEGGLEEVVGPCPASDSDDRIHTIASPLVQMYALQQELQARLEESQRRLASLPFSSSFSVNTFHGIPKDFSQAYTFQGAIIAPGPPSAYFYGQAQERQMLQDGYNNVQKLSAFDSKYGFSYSGDDDIDDDKVEEYLRAFERKVSLQLFKNSACDDARGFHTGVDHNFYLHKFHRKCLARSNWSPSKAKVSQFDRANYHSEVMDVTSSATTETKAPKLKKLRRLQSDDWVLFAENIEIKSAEDITT
eukprot:scaffold27070_cov147-Skeletonema_menzelii.AAC.18